MASRLEWARVLFLLLSLWLGSAVADAAEQVVVRVGRHQGFARIVFHWEVPVRYEARLEGRTLRVTFERALEPTWADLHRRLAAYVASARVEEDGRTVAFALTGAFEFRTFTQGKAVVVDVLGPGDAPAPVGEGGRTAAKAVEVRVEEHPSFSRVVFDWRGFVDYRVVRQGAGALVRFARPARMDLSALEGNALPLVRGATARVGEGDVTVALTLSPGARVRHFRAGTRVIVDVLPPVSPSRIAPEAAGGGTTTALSAARRSRWRVPAAGGPPPLEGLRLSQALAPATRSEPGTGAVPRLRPPEVGAASGPAEERPGARLEPHRIPVADRDDRVELALRDAAKPPSSGLEGPRDGSPRPQPETAGPAWPMVVTAEGRPDGGVRLRFETSRTVPAAVFAAEGRLWVVFDQPFDIDVEPAGSLGAAALEGLAYVPRADATVLSLKLDPQAGATVHRQGTVWLVEPSARAELPAHKVKVVFDLTAEEHFRVVLPIAAPGQPVRVEGVGDAPLVVVPAAASGAGVPLGQRLPDFEFLPTAQGVAIRPAGAGVTVRLIREGVEVTGPDHALSAEGPARGAERDLFGLAAWRGEDGAGFAAKRHALEEEVAAAAAEARSSARLDLARFLFAHGLAAEALGQLRLLTQEDPNAISADKVRALRGAAMFRLGRIDEAAEDLGNPSLDGYRDIELWRGALAFVRAEERVAAAAFARAGSRWRDLPPSFRHRMGLAAAEAALATGNRGAARQIVEAILDEEPPPAVADLARVLLGHVLATAGDTDAALELWAAAERSPDRPARARARLARTELLLALGNLTPGEAIEGLEGLRFAWRGDGFEFKVLDRLGDFYVGERRYSEGLGAFRQAVTHFPHADRVEAVAGKMNRIFRELFVDGAADDLPPVVALATFSEFQELTPIGAAGDAVVRRLAERLAEVDLLEKAAGLIEHQVRFRLKGVERARLGARLAEIRLADGKPDAALQALMKSAEADLDQPLRDRRRRLRARALAALERDGEALALLIRDESPEALQIKAGIYWQRETWAEAAAALERLLDGPAGEPDEAARPEDVVRLAVAVALAGDEAGLRRVRALFGAFMAREPLGEVFAFVTDQPAAWEEVPDVLTDLSAAEAFLAAYRARFDAMRPAAAE